MYAAAGSSVTKMHPRLDLGLGHSNLKPVDRVGPPMKKKGKSKRQKGQLELQQRFAVFVLYAPQAASFGPAQPCACETVQLVCGGALCRATQAVSTLWQ